MRQTEHLPPNYAKLDTALRSIGYSFEAAVADVIDNSVDARSKNILVRLVMRKNQPLDIVIWDDGDGMSPDTLKEAMRFGADVSQEIDRLGKFGLGLKLASLSQAKDLRVYTKQNGVTSARGWLEDGIKNAFACEVLSDEEYTAGVQSLTPDQKLKNSGTLIWWSGLYRVGHNHADPAQHAQKLLNRLKSYLSLAFHRFLSGKPRQVQISLDIFDADEKTAGLPFALTALDPFGYEHSGNGEFPAKLLVEDDYKDRFSIRAHIWPPNSDDPNYKLPGGANSRQGFYFYRNNRLIQGGGWNGIREAEPHSSLARLEIDMAPTFDLDVSLDVKKVEIHLPTTAVMAIQSAKTSAGIDFKKYLAMADAAYRNRTVPENELPLIPTSGLPAGLRKFLQRELRLKATAKHRGLKIQWTRLPPDSFFDFDRDKDRLYLNRLYRKRLAHGLRGSSSDIPVVKCLIFLLLRDALLSQRTGSRIRQRIEQLNLILVKAIKYERIE